MRRKVLLLLFLFFGCCFIYGQGGFIIKNDRKSTRIRFELVNNLIIIPVKLNGLELSFLLDTGVNTTILLDLEPQDSLELRNAEKIQLRGLGGLELIDAYKSSGNVLEIGKLKNDELDLFVIYDKEINFSPRLGVVINGIIGSEFFKNFVVEINYSSKFLRVHDPSQFNKKLGKYERQPLYFYRNKPYLLSGIEVGNKAYEAMLLLDSGLSDAVWIFPQSLDLKVPENSFHDHLGFGLLGDVTGKRGRIESMYLGKTVLKGITASFPDSTSIQGLNMFTERNGSIGGELLKRFNLVMDYSNSAMYRKKNKNFGQPFNYNMSGIVLEHGGLLIIESFETAVKPVSPANEGIEVFKTPIVYKKFALQPSFRIARVRENSPGFHAGLQEGDILVKINRKKAYHYTLEELTHILSSEEGKLIMLEVERDGVKKKFEFRLKKVL